MKSAKNAKSVPILKHEGTQYVRVADIPEPTRTEFIKHLVLAQVPIIPGEGDCVYAFDWILFAERNGLL